MKKILLFILILLSIFLIACSSGNKTGYAVVETNNQKVTSNINQDSTTNEVKEFNVIAKNWGFDPSTITVNKGDKIILMLKA